MSKKSLVLVASHLFVGVFGFALGIYLLPILIAPDAPSDQQIAAVSQQAVYKTQFVRELKDSDALHHGIGEVTIAKDSISFQGKLTPGPNYKLYLSPTFVETEADFKRLKSTMVAIDDIKTFDKFLVSLPANVDPADYTSVIIWCEAFNEFITAGQYRG